MSTRQKLRWCSAGSILVMLLLLVVWLDRNAQNEPIADRLLSSSLKTRRRTLEKLIGLNNIRDLPPDFRCDDEKGPLEFAYARDKKGNKFYSVEVVYADSATGRPRSYGFVFDSTNKCVLRSPEAYFYNFGEAGLCDFGNDGKIEKVITFNVCEKGAAQAASVPYGWRLQVWQLEAGTPVMLFDLLFAGYRFEATEDSISCGPQADYSRNGDLKGIELIDSQFEHLVLFSWSQDRNRFIWTGPGETKYWKVLIPEPASVVER